MRIPLNAINRRPSLKGRFEGKQVRIWSGRQQLWWAPEGKGYTVSEDLAGVFDFEDAWRQTHYLNSVHRIAYVLADVEAFTVGGEADG